MSLFGSPDGNKPSSGQIIQNGRPYDSLSDYNLSHHGTSASGFGSYKDGGGNYHNSQGEADEADRIAKIRGWY